MGTQSNLGWFEWVMVACRPPSRFQYLPFQYRTIRHAIFLAGSFLKRDKKLDTAEVIYVRPMSNADYIIGKTWGIMKVFVSLNMIALLIAGFIHYSQVPPRLPCSPISSTCSRYRSRH